MEICLFDHLEFRAKARGDAAPDNPGLKAGVKEFSDEGL
jgi:hypothetical protein